MTEWLFVGDREMLKNFTPDSIASILRVIMLILSLWSGTTAFKEGGVVINQPEGVAGASSSDVQYVGGNALISLIAGVIFAKPNKLSEVLSNWFGIEGATTATQYGLILSLHKQYLKTSNPEVQQHYADSAVLIVKDLFNVKSDPPPTAPSK